MMSPAPTGSCRDASDSRLGTLSARAKPFRLRTACTQCRAAKVKCSGDREQCRRCENHSLFCEYQISMVGRMSTRRRSGKNRISSSKRHVLDEQVKTRVRSTVLDCGLAMHAIPSPGNSHNCSPVPQELLSLVDDTILSPVFDRKPNSAYCSSKVDAPSDGNVSSIPQMVVDQSLSPIESESTDLQPLLSSAGLTMENPTTSLEFESIQKSMADSPLGLSFDNFQDGTFFDSILHDHSHVKELDLGKQPPPKISLTNVSLSLMTEMIEMIASLESRRSQRVARRIDGLLTTNQEAMARIAQAIRGGVLYRRASGFSLIIAAIDLTLSQYEDVIKILQAKTTQWQPHQNQEDVSSMTEGAFGNDGDDTDLIPSINLGRFQPSIGRQELLRNQIVYGEIQSCVQTIRTCAQLCSRRPDSPGSDDFASHPRSSPASVNERVQIQCLAEMESHATRLLDSIRQNSARSSLESYPLFFDL